MNMGKEFESLRKEQKRLERKIEKCKIQKNRLKKKLKNGSLDAYFNLTAGINPNIQRRQSRKRKSPGLYHLRYDSKDMAYEAMKSIYDKWQAGQEITSIDKILYYTAKEIINEVRFVETTHQIIDCLRRDNVITYSDRHMSFYGNKI